MALRMTTWVLFRQGGGSMSCDCIGLEWCSTCQPGAKVIYKPRTPERYCTVCHDWIVGKTEELRQHRAQAHGWIKGRQPPPKD